MDRNGGCLPVFLLRGVALRKESVDRNTYPSQWRTLASGSLSARRAWIEIEAPTTQAGIHAVALRKESVDRNPTSYPINQRGFVALRKESVDRNLGLGNFMPVVISRSPQGERG